MNLVSLGSMFAERVGSLDPKNYGNETFELWSIPAFDVGCPEVVSGSQIGSAKKCLEAGDVLLSKIVPHIRRAWVVQPATRLRQLGSGEWIVFRGKSFDPDYLKHYLMSDVFHAQFMGTIAGVGGSLMRARPDAVKRFSVNLPPLDEQRRIAAILDQADALRRKRREALARLDGLAASVFAALVSSHDETDNLPFADVVYFQEGPGVRNWQFRDHGVKLINVGNIVDGDLVLSKTNRYLESSEANGKYKHFLLSPGDLVMASSGVTWGKVAQIDIHHLPLCLNTSMIRLRPANRRCSTDYLRSFIERGSFRAQITRLITGSAQPNFGPSHLRRVMIPAVSREAQTTFSKQMVAIVRTRQEYRDHLTYLDALFASLQHRAFRGEL